MDIAYWMLNQILSDVTIEKREESRVIDPTLQWLSCNRISNTDVIFELLHKIRWKNLSYSALKEILATNYEILHVSNIKECLMEKLKYLLQNEFLSSTNSVFHLAINQCETLSPSSSKSRHIYPESVVGTGDQTYLSITNLFSSSFSKILIVGGGFHLDKTMPLNKDAENGLFAYNLENDAWSLFVRLPDQRHHHKLVYFNNRIYVLGGSISHPFEKEKVTLTNWFCSIDRSSLATFQPDKWKAVPSMLEPRVYFGCAILNNKIWVAGGLGVDGKLIHSVEYYDPETNVWKLAKRLRSPRLGCAMTSFHNKLFIVGGYCNLKSKPTLSNVNVYDANEKIWSRKQPLSIARCHGQLITSSNSFYFIGGCTEIDKNEDDENEINDRTMLSLNPLEKYNARQDTWITQAHMKQARHDLCAEIIDDRIFVMNGVNSKRNLILKSMESYDINTGVWTTLSAYSDDYVIGAASCVITI